LNPASQSRDAFVGIGGNVGEPERHVAAALAALHGLPRTRLAAGSRLYRTQPWGRVDQSDFVNAAAWIQTGLAPRELLDELLAIERAHGRVRGETPRWGPRTLDLDLLMHGDAVSDDPALTLPHPHLHERAFVLVPLAEIAPHLVVPGRGAVVDLLAALGRVDCEAIDAPVP
jgi:2-amino-4-hydroxy-6-hydroxymethyldihydropteridine diphosphokinase